MGKFVELSRAKARHNDENVWFEKCRRGRVPFITVTTRTKLADVHWDYITYPTGLDTALSDLSNSTVQGAREIFEKHANSRSRFQLSGTLVWFYDLEIPAARMAAEELFDFLGAQLREPLAEVSPK